MYIILHRFYKNSKPNPTPGYSTLFKNSLQINKTSIQFRRSRPEVFCEKSVLKNFEKFITKHLCQSLFFHRKPRGLQLSLEKSNLV